MDMFNLQRIVKESKLTPQEIAQKANIDYTIIYKIMSGQRKDMYLSTAIKIADALSISLDEFKKAPSAKGAKSRI